MQPINAHNVDWSKEWVSLKELGGKVVQSFLGVYLVDIFGNVYGKRRMESKGGKIKVGIGKYGYKLMGACKDGETKTFSIHRIVASLFLKRPPDGKSCVLHIDGNKLNNYAGNLYWGDHKENTEDSRRHGTMLRGEKHYYARINTKQVKLFRLLRSDFGWTMQRLADTFNVSKGCILWATRHGWKHIQ